MNNKIRKWIHWISTILMCAMFAFSASMYFTKYETVAVFFAELGYPPYLIYPLAWAKVAGILVVLLAAVPGLQSWGAASVASTGKFDIKSYIFSSINTLKEWAYAGFFFDAVLATLAHYIAGHGAIGLSFYAIILVLVSRLTWRR